MKIEIARQNDIPALCGLLDILVTQEAEFKPDTATQRHGARQFRTNKQP